MPRKRTIAMNPAEKPARVKTTVTLSAELLFRLDVHAAKRRLDRSALVEELLAPLLRGVVVSFRGAGPVGQAPPDETAA